MDKEILLCGRELINKFVFERTDTAVDIVWEELSTAVFLETTLLRTR